MLRLRNRVHMVMNSVHDPVQSSVGRGAAVKAPAGSQPPPGGRTLKTEDCETAPERAALPWRSERQPCPVRRGGGEFVMTLRREA